MMLYSHIFYDDVYIIDKSFFSKAVMAIIGRLTVVNLRTRRREYYTGQKFRHSFIRA